MKKQHISSEEKNWRQAATSHSFPLQAGDWEAMERLIDRQDEPVVGGLPGNSQSTHALNARWPFPFLTGVVISLIVLAGQAWSEQSSSSDPDTRAIPNKTLYADQPAERHDLVVDNPLPTELTSPISAASAVNPKTDQPVSGTSKRMPVKPVLPFGKAPGSAVTGDSPPGSPGGVGTLTTPTRTTRPAVSDFSALSEADYTPGLMAFSRLTGKIDVGTAPQLPSIPVPEFPSLPSPKRWTFGLLGGARLTLPDWPVKTISPGGVAGAFVQYDLTPRWSIRTELTGKLLDRNLQRTESSVLLDEFGASVKVDQQANSTGLLFVEIPILVVLRQGRHEYFAGPKLALVSVRNDGTRLTYTGNAFTEVTQYNIQDGIRRLDAGVTLGYGYQLHRHWVMDVRYNQGLLDLTHDNFFNNSQTLINSDLQLTFRYVF